MMITLYHGTGARRADSIREHGLYVGAFDVVSATLDPDLARAYALKGRHHRRPGDPEVAGVLVTFRVDESRVIREEDETYSIADGVAPDAIVSIEPVPFASTAPAGQTGPSS